MGWFRIYRDIKFMKIKTVAARDASGAHKMTSEIELDPLRVLQISTSKVINGQLVSRAKVQIIEGTLFVHGIGRDYSKEISRTTNRVTERVVALQHMQALQDIESLVKAARAHYQDATANDADTIAT